MEYLCKTTGKYFIFFVQEKCNHTLVWYHLDKYSNPKYGVSSGYMFETLLSSTGIVLQTMAQSVQLLLALHGRWKLKLQEIM